MPPVQISVAVSEKLAGTPKGAMRQNRKPWSAIRSVSDASVSRSAVGQLPVVDDFNDAVKDLSQSLRLFSDGMKVI
jgi:cell fate (sporulation/competence/biofilm development) regulator YmcA (YheA/YmcA/DUF963 family)